MKTPAKKITKTSLSIAVFRQRNLTWLNNFSLISSKHIVILTLVTLITAYIDFNFNSINLVIYYSCLLAVTISLLSSAAVKSRPDLTECAITLDKTHETDSLFTTAWFLLKHPGACRQRGAPVVLDKAENMAASILQLHIKTRNRYAYFFAASAVFFFISIGLLIYAHNTHYSRNTLFTSAQENTELQSSKRRLQHSPDSRSTITATPKPDSISEKLDPKSPGEREILTEDQAVNFHEKSKSVQARTTLQPESTNSSQQPGASAVDASSNAIADSKPRPDSPGIRPLKKFKLKYIDLNRTDFEKNLYNAIKSDNSNPLNSLPTGRKLENTTNENTIRRGNQRRAELYPQSPITNIYLSNYQHAINKQHEN